MSDPLARTRRRPGRVSNEIVHITDMFTTLIRWAGCEVPTDRVIDGMDQRAFFGGEQDKSNRQGFLYWNGDKLYGVKWQNFKTVFVEQRQFFDSSPPYANPRIINLLTDPKEREPVDSPTCIPGSWLTSPDSSRSSKPACSVSRSSPPARRSTSSPQRRTTTEVSRGAVVEQPVARDALGQVRDDHERFLDAGHGVDAGGFTAPSATTAALLVRTDWRR